jgi:hypothetical protein
VDGAKGLGTGAKLVPQAVGRSLTVGKELEEIRENKRKREKRERKRKRERERESSQ